MISMSEELDQVKLDNVVLKCHLAVLQRAREVPRDALYEPILAYLKLLREPFVPQIVVRGVRNNLERLVGLRK